MQEFEERKRETEQENKTLKEKINEDGHVISALNDEVVSLRNSYSVMKEEMNTLSFSYQNNTSQCEDNVLRENKNFGNIKVRQSFDSCLDRSSIFLQNLDEDEDT